MARHVEVVKLLMNHPAIDPTVYDMQAVQLAWEGCDLAMIEVLIQDARVVLYDPEAIFIEACTQGTSSLVFHLLDKYPITIAAHVRSFQHACSSGCVEIVAKLLTVQEVKEARYTLSRGLVMACAASRVDVVRLLLTVVNLASSENASYVSKIGNMYLANPRSYSGREREIAQLLLGMHR
ncbi:Hypothetical protein POVR2_LOCUS76 [uncultured virus]|nr:Hypothetical protein POVR2_LOCUS76 [uncultured virus]